MSESGNLSIKEHVDAVGNIFVLSSKKRIVMPRSKPIGGMVGEPVTNASTEEGETSPSSAPVSCS